MAKKSEAAIIIPNENWDKIVKEMYATLPKELAAKALMIVTKYTLDQ